MFKGVKLAGHPDTESCRRSATPTPSTPESSLRPLLPSRHQERPLAGPLGRARANCRRISQASLTVPSIESWRLLNVLERLRKDGPSTPGGFRTWFHQEPQPAWRGLDHKRHRLYLLQPASENVVCCWSTAASSRFPRTDLLELRRAQSGRGYPLQGPFLQRRYCGASARRMADLLKTLGPYSAPFTRTIRPVNTTLPRGLSNRLELQPSGLDGLR